PMSANFLLPHWLPSHWKNYAEGKARAGAKADPADWRITRTIFVADDDKLAEAYARRDANSPYRHYWDKLRGNMMRAKRHVIFKRHPEEGDSSVTLERLLDERVIWGTVNRGGAELLARRERAGPCGDICDAGVDCVDARLACTASAWL